MQMKAIINLILCLFCCTSWVYAQQSYLDQRGQKQIWGVLDIAHLEEPPFQDWFADNYHNFQPSLNEDFPLDALRDTKVTIFLGTWCGDSKYWVPRFLKLWDELGLDRNQLEMVGLHNDSEHYKQGPKGEELGLNIHRVPTFIFHQDGTEIGRMVESPLNSLETDIAQIGLGLPSKPRYRGASYLHDQFSMYLIDSLQGQSNAILRAIVKEVHTASELNTYGYVLKAAKQYEQALFVFQLNTRLFQHHPTVYDSLGEMYVTLEKYEKARNCYKEVLRLKPDDENALKVLQEIEGK